MTDKDVLFTPLRIGNLEIKNRFVQTPVEVGMAAFDGGPTNLLTDYYLERVRGGAGLICTGICRVNNIHGVTSPRQLSLASRRNIKAFRLMTDRIHAEGGRIIVQLHHPGRQTYSAMVGNWPMVETLSRLVPDFDRIFPGLVKMSSGMQEKLWAPSVAGASNIPCKHVKQKTRALRTSEVRRLVGQFVSAADRAKAAGFDGVELHAAHGYLIQQFLSKATNNRTDCYGGSFENRTRFLNEIIKGIRQSCGSDFPLLVRLTVDEFNPDRSGIDLDEGERIARHLESIGVDALDISSGSYEQMNKWLETVNYAPGWRKHLAARIKQAVNIPVIAANLIRSPEQAAAQINEGIQDLIGLGRPLLADPDLPRKIKEDRADEIRRCIVCCQCFESLNKNAWQGRPLRCSVNPELGRNGGLMTPSKGRAVVVGGGPAGLQSAISLAKQGVSVVLFEKKAETGGQLRLADKPPEKQKTGWCVDDMHKTAERLGVDIRLGSPAGAELIMAEKPDGLVIATGARPIVPPIKGIELEHVYSYEQILSGECFPEEAQTAAVIGSGMTGLETAEYLASRGLKVTVVEMAEVLGPDAYFQHFNEAVDYLKAHGCRFITGRRLTEVQSDRIELYRVANNKRNFENGERNPDWVGADTVVLAVGSTPCNTLQKAAEESSIPYRIVGDAQGIGKIADAVAQGYETALEWPFN